MAKIRDFWEKYETKIILLAAFLLAIAISFEAGILKGKSLDTQSVILEKAAKCPRTGIADCSKEAPVSSAAVSAVRENTTSPANAECAFVGSKNSDKYHLPTCSGAKRIKPENLVCFKSAEEATQKGYQPSKDCLK